MPLDVEMTATVARRHLLYWEWVVRVEVDAIGVVIPMPKLCNFYCFSNGACEEIVVTMRCAAIQYFYLYSRVAAGYFKSVV